jgi:hypothetical protein
MKYIYLSESTTCVTQSCVLIKFITELNANVVIAR